MDRLKRKTAESGNFVLDDRIACFGDFPRVLYRFLIPLETKARPSSSTAEQRLPWTRFIGLLDSRLGTVRPLSSFISNGVPFAQWTASHLIWAGGEIGIITYSVVPFTVSFKTPGLGMLHGHHYHQRGKTYNGMWDSWIETVA